MQISVKLGKLPNGVRGTGVIIGNDGRVVTANHVVALSPRKYIIAARANGTKVGCRILAQDAERDLALLACDGLSGVDGVRYFAPFSLSIGSRVVATGNALGGPLIISDGVIAYKESDKGKLLCSLSGGPGMSGGGVFTYDGALVGIIQAGYPMPPFTMISTNTIQLRRFLFKYEIAS